MVGTNFILSHALHLAAQVLFLYGGTLVILFLSACKRYQQLGISVVGNIKLDRNYCKTFLLNGTLQTVQFPAAQKKLTVTSGIMLAPASPPIISHMHILDIQLITAKVAECINQRRFSCPY